MARGPKMVKSSALVSTRGPVRNQRLVEDCRLLGRRGLKHHLPWRHASRSLSGFSSPRRFESCRRAHPPAPTHPATQPQRLGPELPAASYRARFLPMCPFHDSSGFQSDQAQEAPARTPMATPRSSRAFPHPPGPVREDSSRKANCTASAFEPLGKGGFARARQRAPCGPVEKAGSS
jgi:hypothetical protein